MSGCSSFSSNVFSYVFPRVPSLDLFLTLDSSRSAGPIDVASARQIWGMRTDLDHVPEADVLSCFVLCLACKEMKDDWRDIRVLGRAWSGMMSRLLHDPQMHEIQAQTLMMPSSVFAGHVCIT